MRRACLTLKKRLVTIGLYWGWVGLRKGGSLGMAPELNLKTPEPKSTSAPNTNGTYWSGLWIEFSRILFGLSFSNRKKTEFRVAQPIPGLYI